jgi:nucleoside-diphosphate-sugar epimerase
MRVIVFGADGYLGWPLSLRLASRGHEVLMVDNLFTRRAVTEVGSDSAFPLPEPYKRVENAKKEAGVELKFQMGDVKDYEFVEQTIRDFKPDAAVDFAEQRSAPYSMIDVYHSVYTVENNVRGTINLIYAISKVNPDIHFLKMGTMGEYGTPSYPILESPEVEVEIGGKKDVISFPKKGGSYYHWSKVFDTYLLLWSLKDLGKLNRVTDIMQGPVYGTRTEEIKSEGVRTRFDFDEVWGTVVNRFCVEAVLGMPLSPYGKGEQKRGFLSLEDSMRALTALLENPPDGYRVVNQIHEVYSVNQIAEMVKKAGQSLGLNVEVQHVKNPRVEAEVHEYDVESKVLPQLGATPVKRMDEEVKLIIEDLIPYKSRLEKFRNSIMPRTDWKKGR